MYCKQLVITIGKFGCFKRNCKSFEYHLNCDKQLTTCLQKDEVCYLQFVDVIHGSQLEAGVGLIEGEGRKMPWKICNDAARCGTETWEPFCTCLQVTNCLRLGWELCTEGTPYVYSVYVLQHSRPAKSGYQ